MKLGNRNELIELHSVIKNRITTSSRHMQTTLSLRQTDRQIDAANINTTICSTTTWHMTAHSCSAPIEPITRVS